MDDRQILQSFLANCYTDIKIAISKDFRITQVRKCYKKVRKVAEGNEKQKPFTQVIDYGIATTIRAVSAVRTNHVIRECYL
jgi:hypothetical protein